MKKRYIDMSTYKRIDHFNYFKGLANPFLGLTCDVDVTDLVKYCKDNNLSFYLTFIHVVCLAANSIEEFRQRVENDVIVEYDECGTSHTEDSKDGKYCYCTLYHDKEFGEYIEYACRQRIACKNLDSIEEDEDVDGLYFVSCIPWLKYTALIQPSDKTVDSNPRFTWGKYELDDKGRLLMPISVLCHHGLVDGRNIAKFYEKLNIEMKNIINN